MSEIYTDQNLLKEAEKRLNNLPSIIIPGDKTFIRRNANVFINDVGIDSFEFMMRLFPKCIPSVKLAGELENRYIEIWEASYLTERLAQLLISNIADLGSKVIVPMNGCGYIVARNLVDFLYEKYKIGIARPEEIGCRSAIIVDDVLKTGGTMYEKLPEEITSNPNNIYAVWAMSSLTEEEYRTREKYNPLRYLTSNGQKIYAGVVYAGSGLASPGLGLPVNSISTLIKGDDKSREVIADLSEKYFGQGIYCAIGAEK